LPRDGNVARTDLFFASRVKGIAFRGAGEGDGQSDAWAMTGQIEVTLRL
jgi:hypothetical protein